MTSSPGLQAQRYRPRQTTTTTDRHQRAKQYWPIRRASNETLQNVYKVKHKNVLSLFVYTTFFVLTFIGQLVDFCRKRLIVFQGDEKYLVPVVTLLFRPL